MSERLFFEIRDWTGLEKVDHLRVQMEKANRIGRGYIETRLRKLGATGLGTVLDLACGVGHWSVILSELNQRTLAVDSDQLQLEVLSRLCQERSIANIECVRTNMELIPLRSGSVDFVICVNALNFSRYRMTVSEILRVLRPGGKAYLHVNAFALWFRRFLRDLAGLRICSLKYGLMGMGLLPASGSWIVSPINYRGIARIAGQANATIVHHGGDGSAGNAGTGLTEPYFEADVSWCGMELRREFVLEKSA